MNCPLKFSYIFLSINSREEFHSSCESLLALHERNINKINLLKKYSSKFLWTESMGSVHDIKFLPGIAKVNHEVNPSVKLNAKARKRIEKIIRNLHATLITTCQRKFKPTKKVNVMKITVVENVVNQLFRGYLKAHALAEGNRSLLRFHSGVLCYKPRPMKKSRIKSKKKKKKAVKKDYGTKFSKGLADIASVTFPDVNLNRKENHLICMLLGALSQKIAQKAKTIAQPNKCLEPIHIKTILEKDMPERMLTHAEAEGAKSIIFLEVGKICSERTRKRRAKTISVMLPKKKRLVSAKRLRVSKSARKRSISKATKRAISKRRKTPVRKVKPKRKTAVVKKRAASGVKVGKPTSRKRKITSGKHLQRAEVRKRRKISRSTKVKPKQKTIARKKSATFRKRVRKPERKTTRRKSTRKRAAISKDKKGLTKMTLTKVEEVCKPTTRKRKLTPGKSQIRTPKRKRKEVSKGMSLSPKIPKLSSSATEGAIRTLNAQFRQSINEDAVQCVSTKLWELAENISRQMHNDNGGNIGSEQVRQVVGRLFPTELQKLAEARICHVAIKI